MENLLGLIIFLVIAGISVVGKMRESRKLEEERRDRESMPPVELPEATRRMLYGDIGDDIPTARPRQTGEAPPPRPVVVARPAPAPRQEPRRQEATPPVVRPMRQEQPQRPAAPRPPVSVPARRIPVQTAPARQTAARRAEQESASDESVWARMRAEERRLRQMAEANRQKAASIAATRRQSERLFGGAGNLRRGIILREVLGPPLALRETQGREDSTPQYW